MKKYKNYKINENFDVNKILLFLSFFYLFNKMKLNFIIEFLILKSFANRFELKILSNKKFNWNDIFVKL